MLVSWSGGRPGATMAIVLPPGRAHSARSRRESRAEGAGEGQRPAHLDSATARPAGSHTARHVGFLIVTQLKDSHRPTTWLLGPAVVSQDQEPRALRGRRARVTADHRALTSQAASAPAPAPQPSGPAGGAFPVPGAAP